MRFFAAAFIVLSFAAPVFAQNGEAVARDATTVAAAIDVERLPLNLKRIQRELQQAKDIEEFDGLNLRYRIQIYGSAPPLQIFNEDANLNGPAPYGAPTHQEIVNHITPKEYRAPFADFSALFRWLADRNKR